MGDEGDPDVNAQLAALATGLAGLQTAVPRAHRKSASLANRANAG